jgi:Pyruvate/2-oxoacid:ferredoxin oxidoreductase delta subunit
MKATRKIVEIDEDLCDGCGECVPFCAEGAIEIIDGKAKLVEDKYCDGLGACLGECPNDALRIIEREAEEFDHDAVQEFLKETVRAEAKQQSTLACGCPSAQIQTFSQTPPGHGAEGPLVRTSSVSALSHWPVQIRLVPATAPFLKGADLLVAADCTPVMYSDFHRDFLKGRVVLLGCPKFDNAEEYVQKFAEIFNTAEIKSITVLVAEVPCCQSFPLIVEKGLKMAGKKTYMELVVISPRGEILERKKPAA